MVFKELEQAMRTTRQVEKRVEQAHAMVVEVVNELTGERTQLRCKGYARGGRRSSQLL